MPAAIFFKNLFCFVAQLIAASLIRTNTGSETGAKPHFKSDCNPQTTQQYLTPAGQCEHHAGFFSPPHWRDCRKTQTCVCEDSEAFSLQVKASKTSSLVFFLFLFNRHELLSVAAINGGCSTDFLSASKTSRKSRNSFSHILNVFVRSSFKESIHSLTPGPVCYHIYLTEQGK